MSACSDETPQQSDPAASASTLATAPPDAPEDRHGTTVTPSSSASPSWDSSSRSSALEVASRAMRLYVRRDVPPETWWADLEPLLTPAAAQAYRGTDPTWGAPIKITGQADLLDGGSAYLARVHFSTNQGTYMVLLSRDSAGSPWRVERFTPPESLGD